MLAYLCAGKRDSPRPANIYSTFAYIFNLGVYFLQQDIPVRFLRSVRRLLVTANVVRSSPILVTLIVEVLSSFESSVLTKATRRNTSGDAFLHSHRRENLKSYRILKLGLQ
jgi:hypothetical protein